jgi:hypothetical protein
MSSNAHEDTKLTVLMQMITNAGIRCVIIAFVTFGLCALPGRMFVLCHVLFVFLLCLIADPSSSLVMKTSIYRLMNFSFPLAFIVSQHGVETYVAGCYPLSPSDVI